MYYNKNPLNRSGEIGKGINDNYLLFIVPPLPYPEGGFFLRIWDENKIYINGF